MYSFGSFSDMIFLFWACVILFSREYVLHILCWCVLCFRYETYFHLHHDHYGLTYHGGYWAFWPRIRRSTQGVRDCDPFHLPFRAVPYPYPYPYPYPDSVDLTTYPFWAWHDTTLWYHYTTLLPLFALSCYSTMTFSFHHFLDLTR